MTEDTATRVAKFMRGFLLPHAFAFYGGVLKLADDHDRLAAVAGYILAHQKQRMTNRDVQRGCRSMRKLERRDTEAVFEQLDALGWVTRTPGPRPSDPPHWIVNPAVHQKFAERAKAEAERRKKVQGDCHRPARGGEGRRVLTKLLTRAGRITRGYIKKKDFYSLSARASNNVNTEQQNYPSRRIPKCGVF